MLGPSICGDRDEPWLTCNVDSQVHTNSTHFPEEEWGKDMCTDERMHVLLGDITAKLQLSRTCVDLIRRDKFYL